MTMTLENQLQSPYVDVRATALLAQAYAQSIGHHAARALDRSQSPALRWLSPRGVWLSLAVSSDRALTHSERIELETALSDGEGDRPATRITTHENATAWDHEAARIISRTTNGGVDETALAIAPDSDLWYRRVLEDALTVLRKAWPEGAVEFSTLIRNIVVLQNTELTASHDQLFGTLFSGTSYITSVAQAYELLLHECGHHSMFLRVWNDDLVSNPDTLVSHPLRNDPRPISGTLHAAYALWRMHHGLKRWCDNPDLAADAEAFEIMERDRARLVQTLRTLNDSAKWTPAGSALFDNMAHGVLD